MNKKVQLKASEGPKASTPTTLHTHHTCAHTLTDTTTMPLADGQYLQLPKTDMEWRGLDGAVWVLHRNDVQCPTQRRLRQVGTE